MIALGTWKLGESGRAIRRVMIGATLPVTLPCVITMIAPVTTPAMPRVITNGEILRNVIPTPLIKPTNAPTRRTTNNAGKTLASAPLTMIYVRIAARVTTDPAERSIPSEPLMITNVCPAAMTPRKTASRRMFIACARATSRSLPKPLGSSPDKRNRTTAKINAAMGGEMDRRLMSFSFGSETN